jgi:hypothetical protein
MAEQKLSPSDSSNKTEIPAKTNPGRKRLPLYEHRASAGSKSRLTWGLGLERCIGSPGRFQNSGKGFLNPQTELPFCMLTSFALNHHA